jgi:hypothetical protein
MVHFILLVSDGSGGRVFLTSWWSNGWVCKRCFEGFNGLTDGGGSFKVVLGYSDFNNLVLLGRRWLQDFILIPIYEKRFPFFSAVSSAFDFKIVKSAKMTQKVFSKMKIGYQ